MSANPLDRAFGISGDRVTQTSWEQDAIVLCLEQPRQKLRCSACSAVSTHSSDEPPFPAFGAGQLFLTSGPPSLRHPAHRRDELAT